jgi:hypothetical protein
MQENEHIPKLECLLNIRWVVGVERGSGGVELEQMFCT